MSYCRMGPDSDVYLYADINGGWSCCGCAFVESSTARFYSLEHVFDHMVEHRQAAQKVPERVFDRLRREIMERDGLVDIPYVGVVKVHRDKAG